MGALHEGHVSLLREGRTRGDKLALSIFVNPTQFGPKEDLSRYPRDLPGDLAKAASAGTDVAYCPEPVDVYPPGFQTYVQVRDVEQGLDGGSRLGHFAVAWPPSSASSSTSCGPRVALFGEKDWQQLAVIRRMVTDLEMGVEIVGMPIVREPDGLAMSSRNAYLSPEERRRALSLSRGLRGRRRASLEAGEREAAALIATARAALEAEVDRVDYVELRDAATLAPVTDLAREGVLLVAAFVGKTRLIDNLRLSI